MNDLQLNNLLHEADDAAPLPKAAQELAGRVLVVARRRRNVRRTMGGIAVGAIIVVGIFSLEHFQSRPPQIVRTNPKVNLEQVRVELAQFQEQANQHMLVAEQLLKDEKQAHQRKRIERLLSVPDAQVVVESQRDQAAQVLIDRADRLMQRHRDVEQAATAYQRVIELFPTTPAAQTARQRLDNLKA